MKNTDNSTSFNKPGPMSGNKASPGNRLHDGLHKAPNINGLADLQKSTVSLMSSETRKWGFSGSQFNVKRQKIADNLWKITVENPKTKEIILEAQGHGDKIFAFEDNLARMAEALTEKDLTITLPSRCK
jgi:hypothetical protein